MAGTEETRLTDKTSVDGAPPSYRSLFPNAFKPNQIGSRVRRTMTMSRTDEHEETSVSSRLMAFCAVLGCCLCTVAFCLGIPVAMIVIGALNLHDCKIERLIPIWLIVMGVFQSLEVGFRVLFHSSRKEDDENQAKWDPIGCFIFAWFICGNVWVLSNWNDYSPVEFIHEANRTSPNPYYCDDLMMKFSFGVIMLAYAVLGLSICCCCLACCCYFCLKNSKS
ncbi:transmembrane protein 272-like [Corticium candelabrum]|uniref:transmembrane protein 272-like n=1 Tax=Corticium candelabrum TaxID=121492 RepID=UPI002E256D08|nr:transmembrane protein 272-like [Corticium candelabrum]